MEFARRYVVVPAIATALFVPALALASAVPAGFAPGQLWLSSAAPSAGQVVTLTTVLYDASTAPFSGTLIFVADGTNLSSIPFTQNPGESRIFEASWTVTPGTHTLRAHVERTTGMSDTLSASSTSVLQLTIAQPLPLIIAAPVSVASVTQSVLAQTGIASSSPSTARILTGVASSSESLRTGVATYLKSALDTASLPPAVKAGKVDGIAAAQMSTKQGKVLGAQTLRVKTQETSIDSSNSAWYVSLERTVLGALLVIASSAALWYPFLAILFFLILYVVFKKLRHPHET